MKSTYYRELQKYIAAGMSKVDAQLKLEEDYFDFVKSRGLQYRSLHAKRKRRSKDIQTERHHGPVI